MASAVSLSSAWAQAAGAPTGRPAVAGQAAAAVPKEQSSGGPASATDQELRARAEQFWSLWAAGERMKALELVAPDSQDIFLGQPPPIVTSFRFDKILKQASPALAVVYVATERPSPGPKFPGPLQSISATIWKQIGGQWFLTMKDEAVIPGPFGPQRWNPSQADANAKKAEVQKFIEQKKQQIDMKAVEEYLKTHDRIVSAGPGVKVVIQGDDQAKNPKDKEVKTPQSKEKKPGDDTCQPAKDQKGPPCPPKAAPSPSEAH